jgi:hypothetical protein
MVQAALEMDMALRENIRAERSTSYWLVVLLDLGKILSKEWRVGDGCLAPGAVLVDSLYAAAVAFAQIDGEKR